MFKEKFLHPEKPSFQPSGGALLAVASIVRVGTVRIPEAPVRTAQGRAGVGGLVVGERNQDFDICSENPTLCPFWCLLFR